MSENQRQYWAMRTDKDYVDPLYRELLDGRLRQGWGYHPDQDLRLVVPRISNDWEHLTSEQQQVFRHRKMWQYNNEGIRIGDIILVPWMPGKGRFTLVQVTGNYCYEIFDLTKDHGHILPVKVLTPKGVAHYNKYVDADIRRTMRAQSRMWSIDGYAESIEKIVQAAQQGKDLLDESEAEARLNVALDSALSEAREVLINKLGPKLDAQFRAAEWEGIIVKALERLYPNAMAEVHHTGGPNEQGVDIILRITNHFSSDLLDATDWVVLVQVKDYQGKMCGVEAIEQLRQGLNAYEQEGKVVALVVMTNAQEADQECKEAAESLENKTNVPVLLITRNGLLEFIAKGMV